MESPHGKRVTNDSLANIRNKGSRLAYYGIPSLECIPDDVKEIILEYVIFDAKKMLAEQSALIAEEIQPMQTTEAGEQQTQSTEKHPVDYALKTNHPCFRITKKFAALRKKVLVRVLTRLEQKYPTQFAQAANDAATSSARCSFLSGMIQASQNTIFKLTQRITPLMIAVGYDNEEGVKLLLDEAKKKGLLKQYVNLDCGEEHNDSDRQSLGDPDLAYCFECKTYATALHIACNNENKTSARILKALLDAEANPNAQDEDGYTPLGHAISPSKNAVQALVRTSLLLQAGADQTIPTRDQLSPAELNAEPISEVCPPIYKKQQSIIHSLFKKYSKR